MYNKNQWREKGTFQTIYGHQVFVIEEGNAAETLLILHGYPTCSYDYWKVLPLLSKHFRVVIHDHLGFGLSDKPLNYSYSLIDQADMAIALWQKLGIEKAHLLAHDYGTSVATELMVRKNRGHEPIEFTSLTLGNGSMLIEMAKLRPIQRMLNHPFWGPMVAQLSSEALFKRNMRKIWADSSKVTEEELKVLWQLLIHNEGKKVFGQVTQYITERYKFWHRWIPALEELGIPVNLFWAEKDPVAIVEMAHVLHKKIPNSRLNLIPDTGHFPMLESPEIWAKIILEGLMRSFGEKE